MEPGTDDPREVATPRKPRTGLKLAKSVEEHGSRLGRDTQKTQNGIETTHSRIGENGGEVSRHPENPERD